MKLYCNNKLSGNHLLENGDAFSLVCSITVSKNKLENPVYLYFCVGDLAHVTQFVNEPFFKKEFLYYDLLKMQQMYLGLFKDIWSLKCIRTYTRVSLTHQD